MEDYLIVASNGPWYNLFYDLAFLITLFILLFEGYRRKFPLLKWIFMLLMIRLLFITGTKILTFSSTDFSLLFTRFQLPETSGKSLLGGLLFGGIGLLAGVKLFRFKLNCLDAFAVVLPLGIAIQRIGCFVTGCCYGKISYLPWAVKYPVNTLPHFHQFSDKLISMHDFLSLPVHPVQLYEMLGLIAAIYFILKFRKTFKAAGSSFLLSLMLIFIVRFISEFFRDIHAHTIGGEMIAVFNLTQFILLPLIFLLFLLLLKREKSNSRSVSQLPETDFSMGQAFFLFFLLFVCFRMLQSWFVFPEKIALLFTFSVAVVLLVYRIIRHFYFSPYRLLYIAAVVFPFLFMAQTLPFYLQDSVLVKKHKTIKIGFASGNFENSHNIGQGEGCSRISNTEYFKQEYTLGAVALEFTENKPEEKEQFRYGAKAMFGNHRETRLSDNEVSHTTLIGLTPYVGYETTMFGFGGGLHVGNLSYITENIREEGTAIPTTGSKNTAVYPQFYLRFGREKWLFADYHFADHFPSALPGFRHQLGIGTGLGTNNGTKIRLGYNTQDILYFSGYFPIDKQFVLEPMLLWSRSPRYDMHENYYQFSLGLSYRFDFSEGKRIKKY
ncbi:MAG: prolipoprotein diacylglyceryl transferase family protein [Prolixibacteraceae bacterium]